MGRTLVMSTLGSTGSTELDIYFMEGIRLKEENGVKEIIKKADVLIEALPYIKTFAGKTFVIKFGGSLLDDEELKKSILLDVILLKYIGVSPVVIHGGGKEITKLMEKVNKEPEFVEGLRVTDPETMELTEMALVGKINKDLVGMLNNLGGKAVGFSGKDGDLLVAEKRPPARTGKGSHGGEKEVDLGAVGDIKKVNPEIIRNVTENGFIPVISPVAVDMDGNSLNINADHTAGELAGALGAEKLILLTDVPGIKYSEKEDSEVISTVSISMAREMISQGKISSGMIPKVDACIKALEQRVKRTHIIDGKLNHSLLIEIFTDKGIGTMVTA